MDRVDALDGVPLSHSRVPIRTTGVHGTLTLHVVEAGPRDGTPVLLLHGFPDCWYGWRHQIPVLARAGYCVIVPDQRGYNTSDKPPGVSSYRLTHLLNDVVGLQDALCDGAPTHVVGHDWGGGVGWSLATARPDRVRSFTVLNCPRPRVLQRCLTSNPGQLVKSWYILFFQIPGLAPRLLAKDWAIRALQSGVPRGTVTKEDRAVYQRAITLPAMRAAVRWYRAALTHPGPDGPVTVPTLMIWGRDDTALGDELGEQSMEQVEDGRIVWIPAGGHWTPHVHPETVNAHLLQHLEAFGGNDPHVYKIVPGALWDQAPDPWPGSEDDLRDGFVHFSARHQLQGTLDKHFADGVDLRLLRIDPARLPADALRWEVSRKGMRFPHLYGALPHHAVVEHAELERSPEHRWLAP